MPTGSRPTNRSRYCYRYPDQAHKHTAAGLTDSGHTNSGLTTYARGLEQYALSASLARLAASEVGRAESLSAAQHPYLAGSDLASARCDASEEAPRLSESVSEVVRRPSPSVSRDANVQHPAPSSSDARRPPAILTDQGRSQSRHVAFAVESARAQQDPTSPVELSASPSCSQLSLSGRSSVSTNPARPMRSSNRKAPARAWFSSGALR